MHSTVVEVESAVVKPFDGEPVEVHGGVYLSPEAFLSTASELERLRERAAEGDQLPRLLPVVACAAGLAGFAVGYWLANRRSRR